jgi:hypothetical protein
MNGAGYDLVKEYDWQALQIQYRFYTQAISCNGTSVNGSTTLVIEPGVDITAVDKQWQVTGTNINQDTNVVSVSGQTIIISQQASGTGTGEVVLSQTAYSLPPDFERITNRTAWDKTKRWEALGPEDAQQWQWLKSGYISTGPRIRWRILDNQFQVWPPMNTNEYIGWEYELFKAIDLNNHGGCTLSHVEIIKIAKERGYESVMVIEDDCTFLPYSKDLINKIENETTEFEFGVINFSPTLNRPVNRSKEQPLFLDITTLPPKEEHHRGIFATNMIVYHKSIYDNVIEMEKPEILGYYAIDDYIYQFILPIKQS